MGSIYCLYGTKTFTPVYVGQSEQDVEERYWQHWHDAINGSRRKIHRWMRSIFLRGFDVNFHILETGIDVSVLRRRETLWIQYLPNLLNQRMNWWTSGTKASAERISNKCRRECAGIVENYNGWHGIQYHQHHDAYTVRIYYGLIDGECRVDWMREGDQLAGRSWSRDDRWFTDLGRAIEERDKKRKELRSFVDRICGPEWQWPTDRIE
jgi:hypothetical protein